MSPDSIEQTFARMDYDGDDRREPDERRRGQFRAGWEDRTKRRKDYAKSTLKRLTWHNLGYRFGKQYGDQTSEQIDAVFDVLAMLWKRHLLLPEEIDATRALVEGAVCRVSVNAYERNPEARRRCIEHHGNVCCICSFSFGAMYGEVAEGYIHVHHLRTLSKIGSEYVVDAVEDLRPVCPNCHAVLHHRIPAYSIEEVRAFVLRR